MIQIDRNLPVISLNINIDGLPAFKSSKLQLWPILCNVYEIPELRPIVVGIYSGHNKPSDLDGYLRMFVDEMKKLLKDGILIVINGKEKIVGVKIRAFICDSPARAMIKGKFNSSTIVLLPASNTSRVHPRNFRSRANSGVKYSLCHSLIQIFISLRLSFFS